MKRGRDRELELGGGVRLDHTGKYLVQHFQTST